MGKVTHSEWEEHLDAIESQIRRGQSHLGRATIQKLARSPIPPSVLERFCSVARRCDNWNLSLKLLKPVIYPKVKTRERSTVGEKIEYALALQRAGALQESLDLLSHSDLKNEIQAALARAFAELKRWNFAEALIHLNHYLKHEKSLSEYQVLVARVNRLACLSHTGDPRFFAEYDDLSPRLDQDSFRLLWANTQEIWAARMLDMGEYRSTSERMRFTLEKLAQQDGPYHLLLKKYERVAQALSAQQTAELFEFRARALKTADWETLRQLDYYATLIAPEGPWALRAYFGTPYESFRSKLTILRSYPRECVFQVKESSKQTKIFDPWFPGEKEGDLVHRCLIHSFSDWYRPLSLGAIFAALHPDERFDVETSTARVRQLLQRMKIWINVIGAPLRLTQINNLNALRMTPAATIRLRASPLSFEKIPFLFDRFEGLVRESLSAEEWAEKLHLSKRQAVDVLNEGVTAQRIERVGSGRYFQYKLRSSE